MKNLSFKRERRAMQLILFFACLLIGGIVSVCLGQDLNWDLQNYHLYNPFAFLTGRLDRDFMAASTQSYFNPLLDVPFYLAWTSWFHNQPRITAFLMGLPYGVAIFLCLRIALRLLPGSGIFRLLEVLAAVMIGVTGSVTLSEIGTTFGDIPIAVLILCAFVIELYRKNDRLVPHFYSGVFVGLAGGLKLTAIIFAPGMMIAVLFMRRNWRAGVFFLLGWLAGFLVVEGWWAWLVYQRFSNPVFPMFNNVIGSPWFFNVGRDIRFLPHGLMQVIFYPFFWVTSNTRVSEVPMRDARFAAAYVAIIILLISSVWSVGRIRSKLEKSRILDRKPNRQQILLLIFFMISFAIWEGMFSIVRYIVTLELLTGIAVVLGIRCVCNIATKDQMAQKISSFLALMALVTMVTIGVRMDWGHIEYAKVPQLVDAKIELPDNSTVFMFRHFLSFIAPFIHAKNISFIGLNDWYGKNKDGIDFPENSPAIQMVRARLALSPGNTWALTNEPIERLNAHLSPWGLTARAENCRNIMPQLIQKNIWLCQLNMISSVDMK